ncbi:MAG: hypothetical protein BroJett003_05430 [Planctomycetota bacterium]|nr:MAG: hypothetical protein BroJett003_05430 [Planctomycetota bacterium]
MTHTTVGSILRSNQAYCGQLCERHTLDLGVAFVCERFSALPEVNQFREVILPPGRRSEEAFEEAESFFAGRGLTCHRWAPAEGRRIDGLGSFLSERGFDEIEYVCLTLSRWVHLNPAPQVRILPARAMRGAYEATFGDAPEAKAAGVARLDDASLDAFVALQDGGPAGRIALHQVGDIGRIIEPEILAGTDEATVERALLSHVLALAQRLQMRTICLPLAVERGERLARFKAAGFEVDGRVIEYHRATEGAGRAR